MKLLFYSSSKSQASKRVEKTILTIIPENLLETNHTLRSLSTRLMEPLGDLSIAILFIATQDEFSSLLAMKELLQHIRIILILPDRKKATVSMGHRLGARFLSYKDGNFSDIAAVLRHVVEKMAATNSAIRNHPQYFQKNSRG